MLGVRAGDRAPDIAVVAANGARTFLRRLLSYERWTLVLAHGNEDKVSQRAREQLAREIVAQYRAPIEVLSLVPYGAEAEHTFRSEGLAMLVRPDGHTALVAPLDDAGKLDEYLGRWHVARGVRRPKTVSHLTA